MHKYLCATNKDRRHTQLHWLRNPSSFIEALDQSNGNNSRRFYLCKLAYDIL